MDERSERRLTGELVRADARFTDIDYGAWEGRTPEEARAQWPRDDTIVVKTLNETWHLHGLLGRATRGNVLLSLSSGPQR